MYSIRVDVAHTINNRALQRPQRARRDQCIRAIAVVRRQALDDARRRREEVVSGRFRVIIRVLAQQLHEFAHTVCLADDPRRAVPEGAELCSIN